MVFIFYDICEKAELMKQIKISPGLKERVNHISIGSLRCNIDVEDSSRGLINEMQREAEGIKEKKTLEDIARIPEIHNTREAYKALGKKPARYRVSSEALHRRIIQGKGLYFINNAVDITNLISIRSGFGICLYDLEAIHGDITIRVAGKGETYHGIGKYKLNLENLPVFSDNSGPFGSPTSDSERTMIRPQTKWILFNIVSFSEKINMDYWLQQAEELFNTWANGQNFSKATIK